MLRLRLQHLPSLGAPRVRRWCGDQPGADRWQRVPQARLRTATDSSRPRGLNRDNEGFAWCGSRGVATVMRHAGADLTLVAVGTLLRVHAGNRRRPRAKGRPQTAASGSGTRRLSLSRARPSCHVSLSARGAAMPTETPESALSARVAGLPLARGARGAGRLVPRAQRPLITKP